MVLAGNDFHFRYLRALQKQGRANDGASPLAVRYTCLPLLLGANGETRKQLLSALEVCSPGDVESVVSEGIQPTTRRSSDPERLLFGSVWLSRSSAMLTSSRWRADLRPVMSVRELDYAEEAFPTGVLREWADDWFREPSDTALEAPVEKPDVYCVSVLDFDADWARGYAFGSGGKHPFRVSPSVTQVARMMRGSTDYAVARVDGFTAVKVPCSGGRYAMWALMPDRDLPPQALTESMDAAGFARLRAAAKPERVELLLPRFSIKSRSDTGRVLGEMGAPLPFNLAEADFSGMVSSDAPAMRPKVISARQDVDIQIDEHGVKARFVTSFCSLFGFLETPRQSRRIVFDHPFLFLVEDARSGVIQFGGWVSEPKSAE